MLSCLLTISLAAASFTATAAKEVRLCILRHGIAEDAVAGQSDESRKLTDEGRRKTRQVMARARQVGLRPDVILTSPYPRAVATAEIAKEELGFPEAPVETARLVPYSKVFELWEEIRNYPYANELMVVGHNPLLGDLAAWLIGARGGAVAMKKSALAVIDTPHSSPPRGTLIWLLTPKSAGS